MVLCEHSGRSRLSGDIVYVSVKSTQIIEGLPAQLTDNSQEQAVQQVVAF